MEWLLTLATAAGLFVLFVGSELVVDRGISAESTRQIAHAVGAGAAATFPLYLHLRDVLFLAWAFTVVLTYTWIRGSLRSIHAIDRPSIGAMLFPVGLGVAALAAWGHPGAVAFAALVLALADPGASIAGNRIASLGWRVAGGQKSVSGSLAFFVVTAALAAIFGLASGELRPLRALIAGSILTLVEGSLGYGLDNLPLPLCAAVLGETLLGL